MHKDLKPILQEALQELKDRADTEKESIEKIEKNLELATTDIDKGFLGNIATRRHRNKPATNESVANIATSMLKIVLGEKKEALNMVQVTILLIKIIESLDDDMDALKTKRRK